MPVKVIHEVIAWRLLLATVVAVVLGFAGRGSAAAPPVTQRPGVLTVGVAMPSDGLPGRGRQGIRGDLCARARDRSCEGTHAAPRPRPDGLRAEPVRSPLSPGAKPFDLAIGQISITPARAAAPSTSRSRTCDADQGVLAAQTVSLGATSIAGLKSAEDLRARQVDRSGRRHRSDRSRAGRRCFVGNVQPPDARSPDRALPGRRLRRAGARHAEEARAPTASAPLSACSTRASTTGSRCRRGTLLKPVDAAIASLIADGTIDRLARTWLTVDPTGLRVLR